jgi:hypothetical protein
VVAMLVLFVDIVVIGISSMVTGSLLLMLHVHISLPVVVFIIMLNMFVVVRKINKLKVVFCRENFKEENSGFGI